MLSKKVKVPKKYWVKGKSKFLSNRPELQNDWSKSFRLSDAEIERQEKEVEENKQRRQLKYGHN